MDTPGTLASVASSPFPLLSASVAPDASSKCQSPARPGCGPSFCPTVAAIAAAGRAVFHTRNSSMFPWNTSVPTDCPPIVAPVPS